MTYLDLEIEEPEELELEFVEAKIKPEQVGHATPDWEPQTVRPDPGYVFSEVDIDGMPEPTDVMDISENGDYNVARIGTARVDVPQGVFPSGTLDITENGLFSIDQYKFANVQVPFGYNHNHIKIRVGMVTVANDSHATVSAIWEYFASQIKNKYGLANVYVCGVSLHRNEQYVGTADEIIDLINGYTPQKWVQGNMHFTDSGGEYWYETKLSVILEVKKDSVYDVIYFERT